jgi:hypothetical protein
MQKDDDRDDALGVEQVGQIESQIETIMGEAMDGEAARLGLFLEDEQQRLAPAIGPFGQQGHVQLAKTLAQALFELFLADRDDPGALIDLRGFLRGKKRTAARG